MEFIRAGKLRPLAVTTATRSEVLPDVPTVPASSIPRSRHGLPTWVPTLLRAHPPTSARLIAEETEKWAKVIKFAGVKAE
jgi:tripartite-type tricarboxylate transporter receptor subunit TctC